MSEMTATHGHMEGATTLGVPHDKLGMWVFLSSEVMFFSSLIGTFVAFKVRGYFEFGPEVLNIPLTAFNTFLLLASSFAVVMGLDAIQRDKRGRLLLFLVLTLVLGGTFVGIQAMEWRALMSEGVTAATSLFGTVFYVLTGFHGLHVSVGLLWLLFVLAMALQGRYSAENYTGIEVFGLYWHFVDIVWIILFTLIYLL